ncbi:MAG: AAA family ATPase [Planctomycetaceae bacterium]
MGASVPGQGRQITVWGLLDAFRRRWIPTLALAIPAALLVAAAIWELVPAKYESVALLKIHQFEQIVYTDTPNDRSSEFLTYRDSQINFLKSRPVLTAALRAEGVAETKTLRDVRFPVEWLEDKLDVAEDLSPEFVRISLAGEYPDDLALVVDAVKDAYLDEVVYNERKERINRLKELEQNFNDIDLKVKQNDARIDALARDLGTTDSRAALQIQDLENERLRDLQKDLGEINAKIRAEETARQFLQERGLTSAEMNSTLPGIGFGPLPSAAPSASPLGPSAGLQQQLLMVQREIKRFQSQTRNPNHPDLLALKDQESQLLAMLTGASPKDDGTPGIAMSQYEWLTKQKEKLEAEFNARSEELHQKGIRLAELERERSQVEHLKKLRDQLADDMQKQRFELNRPQRVEVIQAANIPEKRNVKSKMQLSGLGGASVLFSIIAGFTLFEWFSHRVGQTSDVTNQIGLRLIGTIPSPDKGGLLGLGIFAGKVDYDEWNRAVIESMDVVRTYLTRHIDPSRPASVLITSASANEGKTTVSCQLAASLARTGKRVVLVDCDFRRPSAHLMMDGREGPGISEYLRGEVALADVCQATQANGLTFVAAGRVDALTLQKLSFDGGRSLIDALKAEFDFVIIDTSPLLFVAEPSMLSQNADIVLMSTRKDYSRIPYVMQSRDSLRSLQVPLLGAVMVGADSDFQRQTYGYRQEIQRSGHLVHS